MNSVVEKPVDVVIDLETLGTKPGCVILAIGAATVGSVHEDVRTTYYDTIGRGSCEAVGLTVDANTVDWWSKQDPSARLEVYSGRVSIQFALENLSTFLRQFPKKRVWGNSAAFDLGVLEAAYNACNLPVPWTYKEEMCFRTAKNLFPKIAAPKFGGLKHKAVDDALNESWHLESILARVEELQGVPL